MVDYFNDKLDELPGMNQPAKPSDAASWRDIYFSAKRMVKKCVVEGNTLGFARIGMVLFNTISLHWRFLFICDLTLTQTWQGSRILQTKGYGPGIGIFAWATNSNIDREIEGVGFQTSRSSTADKENRLANSA